MEWLTARVGTAGRAGLCAVLALAAACNPPIRQYDLENRRLTCAQANAYVFRTLHAMGFRITSFEPAAAARAGAVHAVRADGRTQRVTVAVRCTGNTADIDAREDGKWLGQLELKRGFYLSFTAVAAQAAAAEAAARQEAQRPLPHRTEQGLHVLVEPRRGFAAKLDFGLDLAAAGVLPIRITINNVTSRTYDFDPHDIALIRKDGARVHPMAVADAAARVAASARPDEATPNAPPVDPAAVAQRLHEHLLKGHSVTANQQIRGYLFFPLAQYVKGRVLLEDRATEETEGFVVEF
ncbi:MAG: hypothetical protein ACE5I7_02515 [Candidatus Binatia bacterium]